MYCHSGRAHLADSNDDDALATSDSESFYAKVVEVLPLCLGSAHIPPPRLREIGQPGVLQHLCSHRQPSFLFRLSNLTRCGQTSVLARVEMR